MQTTTIEEISATETINGATIVETIAITTVETTPTPAERQPHNHHHQHHHHHRHHHHKQHRAENETTVVITDVSDDATLIVETDTEQPQDRQQQQQQHHKEQQTAPQPAAADPLEPPPLPTSTPPYLTPTEELAQVVWQTDLDAAPQTSEAMLPAASELSSPPDTTATVAATAATAAATITVTTQPIAVCETELVLEPTQISQSAALTELVLVGAVSGEASDKPKERKSYRVSCDLAAPPQEPRTRCCCSIA